MAMITILTTQRLRLRTWRSSDTRAYARHCNTLEVMEFLGGVMTPTQLKREVQFFRRRQERDGQTFWIIERKRDRAFVGICGLVRVRETSSPLLGEIEIGWRVRADMWRQGYASEAATATLNHAFDRLGVERVVARVAAGNVASQALCHKLGLRRWPHFDHGRKGDHLQVLVFGARGSIGNGGCDSAS